MNILLQSLRKEESGREKARRVFVPKVKSQLITGQFGAYLLGWLLLKRNKTTK